ncbi:putative NADH:ubiquinone reductase (non-electrogenic) [Helianthus anomalus]
MATDEWLRVEGVPNVYALGDCATINQRKVMEDISAIFSKADKNKSGKLNVGDFGEVINDIIERYPQVELHLKSKKLKNFVELLQSNQDDTAKKATQLDIEKFRKALSEVDTKMKSLPLTAQKRGNKDEILGKCLLPLYSVHRRWDNKVVHSKWHNLEKHKVIDGEKKEAKFASRIHL